MSLWTSIGMNNMDPVCGPWPINSNDRFYSLISAGYAGIGGRSRSTRAAA
jgi:hypothetical protein